MNFITIESAHGIDSCPLYLVLEQTFVSLQACAHSMETTRNLSERMIFLFLGYMVIFTIIYNFVNK